MLNINWPDASKYRWPPVSPGEDNLQGSPKARRLQPDAELAGNKYIRRMLGWTAPIRPDCQSESTARKAGEDCAQSSVGVHLNGNSRTT